MWSHFTAQYLQFCLTDLDETRENRKCKPEERPTKCHRKDFLTTYLPLRQNQAIQSIPNRLPVVNVIKLFGGNLRPQHKEIEKMQAKYTLNV